jgi:phosphatidate cytidylyltransferase
MKSILLRALTGAIYVTIILLSVLIHPIGLKLVTLAMNLIALIEFDRIGQKLGLQFTPAWIPVNMLLTCSELILIHFDIFESYGIVPFILFVIVILSIALYQKKGNPFTGAAFSFFAGLFITLPLILLNLIHEISIREAIPYTLAIFIFIWTNDTFAYLFGMGFGRHRLFERISPKKSWEGFIGGLIMVTVSAYIIFRFFPTAGLIHWIIFALLTAISSVFGDFNESLLKRIADIKDSGKILPGHGGMLDRIDSLLLASPVIYIYLLIFLNLK